MSNLIKHIIDNKLQNDIFFGSVLWYSQRNGNGIIKLKYNDSEVYFDSSVIISNYNGIKSGYNVSFQFNNKILDCACAKNVIISK